MAQSSVLCDDLEGWEEGVGESLKREENICMCYAVLSCIQLFLTPWTIFCQAPLTMGFPRQLLEWVAISFCKGSS